MKNNRKTIAGIIFLLLVTFVQNNHGQNAQDQNKKKIIEKGKAELMNAELEFYNASQKIGWGQAFINFADDNANLLRQDQYPVIGKSAIIKLYKGKESNILPIKWSPTKAEVSNDGSLGYTWGNWTYTSKDKNGKEVITYGNYVTIWKKQPDRKWKFVLDGGNTTPAPEK